MRSFVRQNLGIIIGIIILYIINKFLFRPCIVSENISGILSIIAFSFPNFCEAVVGSLFIANVTYTIKEKYPKVFQDVKLLYLNVLAVFTAGIYVLLQEYKIHNLGGENVFDVYDVLFSCIGLLSVLIYFLVFYPKKAV